MVEAILNEDVIADLDDFVSAFDPKDYLQENFLTPDIEDQFAAHFLAKAFKGFEKNLLVLEFGGGPSLFSVATYAPLAREIHFSDYVPESLNEVQRWIDKKPDAYNWREHIRTILMAEGLFPTDRTILNREALIRRRLTKLMTGDARAKNPIGKTDTQYDLVAAHHCLDVASTNYNEFLEVMDNVTGLVAPGGWLAVSITTGTTVYSVGEKQFACSNLTMDHVKKAYSRAGYEMNTLIIDTMGVPQNSEREYSGIVMALAQKMTN